ncbi:MAG: methanogenesis marker 12 protein [Methanophagales archaeon]|nr:methanogenesis marker 12 protein [Methanophagales archaeon]MCW3139792.1 methanogenesis marker 12 protein [Methanophagales archaeon]MCW7069020.1 methanogenesis marker 12 protein [Methanophagales archaeon]MCW7072423.1 methanogenesis marker 12 protein [Methanophagales archaeon]
MFIGIDHGTTGIRFAGIEDVDMRILELSREEAARMDAGTIVDKVETGLETRTEEIELIALTYSMGDGFSRIKKIEKVNNRGLSAEGGAGMRVGGGTNVFDAIKNSGIPTIMIPGIHARSESIDQRMRFYSHCASPEKVGVAYHIYKKGFEHFIFSDISSNTVTICVVNGVIIGGIDACIGAPGLYQGPIDLQLIRDIDSGRLSAGDAFANAGVMRKRIAADALATLSLFVAMEISAMRVLTNDYGICISADAIFLTGSEGEKEAMKERVDQLLGVKTRTLTRYSAAIGCAEIARDVYYGKREIMGIKVEL